MKTIVRISAALALTLFLAVATLADGPANPPCDPGETHGPPCSANQLTDDVTAPIQTETAPTSEVVVATSAIEEILIVFLLF
jgi:hypothetical protein